MLKILLGKDWNKHKEGTTVTVDDLRAASLRKPALKPRKERSRSEFSFGPYQTPTPRLSQIACPAPSSASRLRLQPRVDVLVREKRSGDSRDPAFTTQLPGKFQVFGPRTRNRAARCGWRVGFMSALTPKADIGEGIAECPLLTQSGH